MQGQWDHVLLAFVTAVIGVYLVSVAVAGFMTRHIGWLHRLAFAVAGIAMMIPANAFPGALWTDIAGFVAGVLLIVIEIGVARRRQAVT